MRALKNAPWLLAAALLPLLALVTARADGEAGVVIEFGEGDIETYCIPFEGDSITGEDLIDATGYGATDFNGLVCSIGDIGCSDASSFSSCVCECANLGDGCTYWALFERPWGSDDWLYSSQGFRTLRASDGDVQGWRWGPGQPANAPPPPLTSFEDICGHPPRSLSASGTAPAATTGSPTMFEPTASGTSAPRQTADDNGDTGGSTGQLIGFGVVAGLLVAGVIAAFIWRARNGSAS
jgi:hypothetical protein